MERLVHEPKTEFDTILTPEEILQFGDEIIWPVVNNLDGRNFRLTACPGEEVGFCKTVIDQDTGEAVQIEVEAECYDDYESDQENARGYSATICVKQKQDDHTKQMLIKASGLAEHIKAWQEEFEYDDEDEEEIEALAAWHVKYFKFYVCADENIDAPVDIEGYYQLIDSDGDEIWSDREMVYYDQNAAQSSEDIECILKLDADLAVAMTEMDKLNIMVGLELVGHLPSPG